MKKDFYFVSVDENNKYTSCQYRKVTREELDKLIDVFGKRVLEICSNGKEGAMAMWACFKNQINQGCYSDMINAYRLLADDSKSLVDREHELRHAWCEYKELTQIRYYGSVEEYYLKKAKEAKERFERYAKTEEDENKK